MQNILVIMEASSFLARNITEQLEELHYKVVISPMEIEEISLQKGEYEAIFLYTECDADDRVKELVYIRDKAIEESIPVFYFGDEEDLIRQIMPEHILKNVFGRPIDVKAAAKTMDAYIKKYGKLVKKKVLVVDDSGAMLRNVKGWLEEKYNVVLANSGAMAIKYLATDRPDLVLLDYEMPVVDGRQVLQMMRSENDFRNIPVIFLTSKNDRESIMKVMELKPNGYLLKTMEPQLIVKEVDDFFMKQKCNKLT